MKKAAEVTADALSAHAERIANAFANTSYGISFGLVLNGVLNFIDAHAWVVGAVLWVPTYLTQRYYQKKSLEAIIANGGERRKRSER